MKITIYDDSFVKQSALYSWVSLAWDVNYNDMGMFILSMRHSSETFNSIKKGWFLTFDEDITKTVMIVDTVQVKKGLVAFSGKSAAFLLRRRMSTTVISNQNAESAIRYLLQNMTPIPHFLLDAETGLSDVFSAQISDKQVSDYVLSIAQMCDIGFRAQKSGDNIVFSLYKPGLNENIKFAQKFGNIGNEKYTASDVEFYNVAFVAGMANEDGSRVSVWAGNTDLKGMERRELYVDARDLQQEENENINTYKQRLVARGEKRLLEQLQSETIGFEVSENVNLGDIINVYLDRIGLSVQARITTVSYAVQNNKMKRSIDVGIPIKIRRY